MDIPFRQAAASSSYALMEHVEEPAMMLETASCKALVASSAPWMRNTSGATQHSRRSERSLVPMGSRWWARQGLNL